MPQQGADVRLASIVRRQHGAFSRVQALACGFTSSTIARRVRSSRWIKPHSGVFVDPAVPWTPEQSAMAACLACGPGARASHLTAGSLLGLDVKCDTIDVTVPPGRHPRPPGIRVHRASHVERVEIASVSGVPITSPMRVLADLAADTDPLLLEIMLDTFWRRGSVEPTRMARYLRTVHQLTRPGTDVLRALMDERIGERPPDSDLETVYVQILKAYGVPLPVRQHWVSTRRGRRRIDLAYPPDKIAIELNGFDRHARDRLVFDDDHVRRNELEALKWSIREFTWTHCVYDRLYVATTTAEAIGLVPVRWAPART